MPGEHSNKFRNRTPCRYGGEVQHLLVGAGDAAFDRCNCRGVSSNRLMELRTDRNGPRRRSTRIVAPILLDRGDTASDRLPAVSGSGISPERLSDVFQRKAPSRTHTAVALTTILISAVLVFSRLGHYALWDDEAQTALFARNVWLSGDTLAMAGKNIVAYRDGAVLDNMKERYEPPLQHFLAAPFAGLWPGSALAVRVPFAVAGLLSVALVFWWLRREQATLLVYLLTAMGFIGNVSFLVIL